MEGEGDGVEGELNGEILGPCLTSHIDEESTESHRYYLARRTVLEMIKDRGYSVPTSEIDLSLQDFRAIHGQNPDVERLRISTTHHSDPLNRVSFSGFVLVFGINHFFFFFSFSVFDSLYLVSLV